MVLWAASILTINYLFNKNRFRTVSKNKIVPKALSEIQYERVLQTSNIPGINGFSHFSFA